MTTTANRRFGFKRWIILALVLLGGILAFGVGGVFTPISPVVVIPGEPVIPGVDWFTNTMLATLIADLVLLALAWGAFQFSKSGKLVPSGINNAFETLVEFLWNTTESSAGKWAKSIFPIVATIFFLVFAANMTKLIPGYEAIGWPKVAHEPDYARPVEAGPLVLIRPLTADEKAEVAGAEAHTTTETTTTTDSHGTEVTAEEAGKGDKHSSAAGCAATDSCEVVPFLRGAATDLNFTFALAISVMIMVQVMGVRALGMSYFTKFINVGGLISKPGFGIIDFGVGLLELVSEISKVLSFSFRLFGNIFAGTLLLSILGTLTVVVLPVGLYLFEMFFGTIQAYVFAMLSLVFLSQATVSHHGDDHGHEEGHH